MPRFRDPGHTSRPSGGPLVVEPKIKKRSVDPAVLQMIDLSSEKGIITAFDRVVAQQPQCQTGVKGTCCRFCMAGPCRVIDGDGPKSKGICGASAWTIAARNTGLLLLTGAASHSEHAHVILETVHRVAHGQTRDYILKDTEKLRRVCARLGIKTGGRDDLDLARELCGLGLNEYSRLKGEGFSRWVKATVTEGRNEKFLTHDIMPGGIYNVISELVSQAHVGMDNDPVNIIFSALRVALADYVGMHIGTDFSDILFGAPQPVVSEANFGVIDPDWVNIALYGHNPVLSELICDAAESMQGEARAAGAKGIKLMGICCTGNEVIMRRGVPIVTSYAAAELPILTGAMDAYVVDVQCIMPSIRTVAECYQTRIITTSPISKIPGSYHLDFQAKNAMESARSAIGTAIEAYKLRLHRASYSIPRDKYKVVSGWSLEALYELFGSINPDNPVSVLTEAILSGEIKGVALLAGCNNLKRFQDDSNLTVAREMIRNDVFTIGTGCVMQGCARAGLLSPEAMKCAGKGLQNFLRRLEKKAELETGLAPIFHMGSCVDNTRCSDLLMDMAREMGVDTPKVPWVASAPEAMSGKAVSIGSWCVAMGMPVHVGAMPPVQGSSLIYGILTQVASDVYGGYFIFETDPALAAKKMLSALEYRNWKMGIHRSSAKLFNTSLCRNY